MFDLLSIASGAAWLPVADAIAKATLLFAAAGFASFMLRRRSAAARHMIWTLALVSVLVLPVLSIALPRWQLPIVTLEREVPQLPVTSFQLPAPRSERPAPAMKRTSAAAASVATIPLTEAAPARTPMSWSALLLTVWLLGASLILARLCAGILAVHWMSRRTERVINAPWLQQAQSLAAELGLSPRIVFLRSRRAAMPMAWGVFRPAVLMPSDADAWPAERLRIVLLHELAHVKRRDCLTHMLAQISCALYWFNPLAWIAARHARTERERACDDLVLAAGTPGPDYADQLIEIARVMRSGRFPAVLAGASLAMAHRSELEGRLMAILDPSVPRAGMSRLRTAAATTVFALAVMPLASVQPWTIAAAGDRQEAARPPDQSVPPATQSAQPAPAPSPQPMPARRPERSAEGAAETVSAAVQSVIQSAVQSGVQSAVQSGVQSGVGHGVGIGLGVAQAVGAGVQSALENLDLNTNINSQINTNVNAQVNSHVNKRGAGSWEVGAGSWEPGDRVSRSGGQGKATDPRMVAALTAALKDTDKEVRETALHALVQLRDPSIFDPLVQALTDAAADVREQAAFGLGQLRDRRAVEPLTNALKDQNADVRQQAVFALGQLRDRSALPGLTAALKDSDEDVREQAVFALGQIRDPGSVDPLVSAMRDAKPDVRQQAVFALGQIRDRRAVEPLISALKDTDADVREQAAFALGQIRDRGAVEALVIALKDTVADVREQVAFALGQIRDPRAIDGLTAALKDASADVRRQAAFALGQLAR
jgi:HEAT repeat protein/beta-lactamase regulating signal transducer with metallopeptidase domain